MAGEDPKYLDFIRKQACAFCSAAPPSHPHHHTHNRAYGKRAHDRDAMPLCWKCHRRFHDAAAQFESWNKQERRAWQDRLVAEHQALWETMQDEETF